MGNIESQQSPQDYFWWSPKNTEPEVVLILCRDKAVSKGQFTFLGFGQNANRQAISVLVVDLDPTLENTALCEDCINRALEEARTKYSAASLFLMGECATAIAVAWWAAKHPHEQLSGIVLVRVPRPNELRVRGSGVLPRKQSVGAGRGEHKRRHTMCTLDLSTIEFLANPHEVETEAEKSLTALVDACERLPDTLCDVTQPIVIFCVAGEEAVGKELLKKRKATNAAGKDTFRLLSTERNATGVLNWIARTSTAGTPSTSRLSGGEALVATMDPARYPNSTTAELTTNEGENPTAANEVVGSLSFYTQFTPDWKDKYGQHVSGALGQVAGVAAEAVTLDRVYAGSVVVDFRLRVPENIECTALAKNLSAGLKGGDFMKLLASKGFPECTMTVLAEPSAKIEPEAPSKIPGPPRRGSSKDFMADRTGSMIPRLRSSDNLSTLSLPAKPTEAEQPKPPMRSSIPPPRVIRQHSAGNPNQPLESAQQAAIEPITEEAPTHQHSNNSNNNGNSNDPTQLQKQVNPRPFGEISCVFGDLTDQSYFLQMRELEEKRQKGLITDQDFAREKRRIKEETKL